MWEQLVGGIEHNVVRPENFQSKTDLDLEALIDQRLYVDIVDKTKQIINEASEPTNDTELEALLHVWLARFRALLSLRNGTLVAQEAQSRMKHLEELPVTPSVWELRVLLIPVWAKGINQTALQKMYQMGIEARTQLMTGKDTEVWATRLRRLGLDVSAALVGMRDFQTAINHLESLHLGESYADTSYAQYIARVIALCYVNLGDTSSACEWTKKAHEEVELQMLVDFSDEKYDVVVACSQTGVTAANIKALAYLHQGKVDESVQLLENALEESPASNVLFNLFMTYDLIESDSMAKKREIIERLSSFGALSNYDMVTGC